MMQRLKTTGNYEKTAALAKANLDTLLVALGAGKNSVETNSKTKKENLFSTIKSVSYTHLTLPTNREV